MPTDPAELARTRLALGTCPITGGRERWRFVRFPGENNELPRSGKPSHRVQRFGYILDWFAAKLMAPAE